MIHSYMCHASYLTKYKKSRADTRVGKPSMAFLHIMDTTSTDSIRVKLLLARMFAGKVCPAGGRRTQALVILVRKVEARIITQFKPYKLC